MKSGINSTDSRIHGNALVKLRLSFGMLFLAFAMVGFGGASADRILILAAVICSFIRDLTLRDILTSKKKLRLFGVGMGAITVAHILYAEGFSYRLAPEDMENLYLGYLFGFVIFCIIAFTTLYKIMTFGKKIDKGLFIVYLAYLGVIGYNLIRIFGYSIVTSRKLFIFPAWGITLFFISDCLGALKRFIKLNDNRLEVIIWILYVTGQTLMIIG